jgi:uncharacterized membrane protein YvlD (DUF360 family)
LVVSTAAAVVSTIAAVVSTVAAAVSTVAAAVSAVASVVSALLQAVIKPATARIANTFFIVLVFGFFYLVAKIGQIRYECQNFLKISTFF